MRHLPVHSGSGGIEPSSLSLRLYVKMKHQLPVSAHRSLSYSVASLVNPRGFPQNGELLRTMAGILHFSLSTTPPNGSSLSVGHNWAKGSGLETPPRGVNREPSISFPRALLHFRRGSSIAPGDYRERAERPRSGRGGCFSRARDMFA